MRERNIRVQAPLRVLIVEDSEDDALLLLGELRRGGYGPVYERVDTAEAMRAALDRDGWDLVLSDHSMPAFDSSAALEVLRERGIDLPFIIVSGRIGEGTAVAAMRAGAHDYIMKDNLRRLNTAIERELREAESRRERRRAQEALRRAEEKYRGIFENAVEGIFQTTVKGQLLTANPAMAHLFGYESPEKMLEEVDDTAQLYVEPERRVEFAETACQNGVASGFEVEMYRKDGSRGWVSASARAVRDGAGEVMGFEGTLEDITERKRAEAEMREIREAERRRIARDLHDVVLQDLTYSLQSMQMRRMCHEDETLKEELSGEIDALQKAVGGLRAAIYNLRGGLKELSFIHSLESLVELNRQMAPERYIELTVEDGFPEELAGEGGVELLRVIQEALVNVRRHSGARWVRVATGLAGGEVAVEVSDDGRGFDPKGTAGFGLTGMGERILALGGDIEVESEPGAGSKVRVRIPMGSLSREYTGVPAR